MNGPVVDAQQSSKVSRNDNYAYAINNKTWYLVSVAAAATAAEKEILARNTSELQCGVCNRLNAHKSNAFWLNMFLLILHNILVVVARQ